MSDNDDGYGRAWEYRVLSQLDAEPDVANSGRRHLHIRKVWWAEYHRWTPDYPVPTDVFAIEHAPSAPEGQTAAELILDLERMLKACDRPALILAEWKDRRERVATRTDKPAQGVKKNAL